jgi:archaellin
MKKLSALIWLILVLSCNNGKDSVKTTQVKVDLSKTELKSFSFGYNTANTFKYTSNQEEDLFRAIEKIAPQTLRFPGGTIANFFHPGEKNYGFKSSDTLQIKGNVAKHIKKLMDEDRNLESSNYLDECIALCKKTKSSILLVANVLNGNVSELEMMITSFQKNDIKIEGIELGNELYLKAYKDRIPTAQEYITLCKPFAVYLKNNFPEIPISVSIESKGDDVIQLGGSWNSLIAQQVFFDAISFHYYFRSGSCENKNEIDASDCYSKNTIDEYADNFEPTVEKIHQQFPSKQIWLTEFNLFEPGKNIGGTNAHGLLLMDLSLRMQKNLHINKVILHNLAGTDKVFSTLTITHNSLVKNPLYEAFSNVQSQLNNFSPIPVEQEVSSASNTYYFSDFSHKTVFRIVVNMNEEKLKIYEPLFLNNSDSLVVQAENSTLLKSDTNIGNKFSIEESNKNTLEVPGYSILLTKYILK